MRNSGFESRLRDVQRFYTIMDELEHLLGGKRTLAEAHGGMGWPRRGVYFFFEPGECRTTSGTGLRVTRVGTHALNVGGKRTLWGRLRLHRGTVRGTNPGGGNHRLSVFRHHVGTALAHRDNWPAAVAGDWARRSHAEGSARQWEHQLEQAVSQHIRSMPFLWLSVDDEPGPMSLRAYLERDAIGLLSNYNHHGAPVDSPSSTWLGQWAASEAVRQSGLWNVSHVADVYEDRFLEVLQRCLP